MLGRGSNRPFPKMLAAAAVVLVAAAIVCWLVRSFARPPSAHHADRKQLAEVPAGADLSGVPGTTHRVDIPVALLADYYEHITEHTPPRDPSGSMQRRERHYRAPGDPFGRMSSAAGKGEADAQLRATLEIWEKGFRSGGQDPDVLADVVWLVDRSSLSPEVLMDAGRALDFLIGDKVAAQFFNVALEKAQQSYKTAPSDDPSARRLLDAMDQTKALWRLRDFVGLEKRFALAMTLYPPLSVESRRAGCLYATAVYYQNRPDDAVATILKVWEQDRQIGDLGALEKSDVAEMNWLTGGYLFSARRFKDAIPYYQAFLRTDDGRKRDGADFLSICLAQTGQIGPSDTLRREYGLPALARRVSEPTAAPLPLNSRIQGGGLP